MAWGVEDECGEVAVRMAVMAAMARGPIASRSRLSRFSRLRSTRGASYAIRQSAITGLARPVALLAGWPFCECEQQWAAYELRAHGRFNRARPHTRRPDDWERAPSTEAVEGDCASPDDPGLAYRHPIAAVLSIAPHDRHVSKSAEATPNLQVGLASTAPQCGRRTASRGLDLVHPIRLWRQPAESSSLLWLCLTLPRRQLSPRKTFSSSRSRLALAQA
ncbi:hypothetical protein CC78DRAFT_576836 [Lojkania enalia]|uniref:Uncharacterized protein n=1 Tax=Lojkania enalia TaxID=147567 RepID=A0A9P4N805_9PLEO|nr:hypothetical protein CC78DRAFT_576836 [Didymosphaeria enalia]